MDDLMLSRMIQEAIERGAFYGAGQQFATGFMEKCQEMEKASQEGPDYEAVLTRVAEWAVSRDGSPESDATALDEITAHCKAAGLVCTVEDGEETEEDTKEEVKPS